MFRASAAAARRPAFPNSKSTLTGPSLCRERWVTGEIGGVCIDSQDHMFVVQRVSDVGGMDGHLRRADRTTN